MFDCFTFNRHNVFARLAPSPDLTPKRQRGSRPNLIAGRDYADQNILAEESKRLGVSNGGEPEKNGNGFVV